MSAPGVMLVLLEGRQAAEHAAELQALHHESCGEAGDDAVFAGRLRVWCRQPGFALAEARHGRYLAGYACGMPLRASTSWWKSLTSPLPAGVTTEHPGRTFALASLLVRPSWRRQGIGTSLHGLLLDGRPEERATVMIPPRAAAAQAAFRAWGWQKIARAHSGGAGSPVLDVLVTVLHAARD